MYSQIGRFNTCLIHRLQDKWFFKKKLLHFLQSDISEGLRNEKLLPKSLKKSCEAISMNPAPSNLHNSTQKSKRPSKMGKYCLI